MAGSSVHFKKITSPMHAVSHADRQAPPDYLLPSSMSMGAHVVIDDRNNVQRTFSQKMKLASRQAKANKDYSPLWEGVMNMPQPREMPLEEQKEMLKKWCVEYEKITGHKVLRADLHLDEGHIANDGKVKLNPHAHVMCDRTDDHGKVKKLSPVMLRDVQTMTSDVTGLSRGIDARKTGRKHIGHQNFKYVAEKNRLDLDGEKLKAKTEIGRVRERSLQWSKEDAEKLKTANAVAAKVPDLQSQINKLKEQLEEQYRLSRQALKDSKTARQDDYQALKKAHEIELKDLAEELATAKIQAAKVPELEAQAIQQKEKYRTLHVQAVAIQTERNSALISLAKAEEKVGKITQENKHISEVNANGKDPALFVPAPVATKQPLEAPAPQALPTPLPTTEKPLVERLAASMRVFLDWVKDKGGEHVHVDTFKSEHYGPVVQVDGLHAVQSTGRGKYAIHQLDHLDKVPVLDDPKIKIQYKNGVASVKGEGISNGKGR